MLIILSAAHRILSYCLAFRYPIYFHLNFYRDWLPSLWLLHFTCLAISQTSLFTVQYLTCSSLLSFHPLRSLFIIFTRSRKTLLSSRPFTVRPTTSSLALTKIYLIWHHLSFISPNSVSFRKEFLRDIEAFLLTIAKPSRYFCILFRLSLSLPHAISYRQSDLWYTLSSQKHTALSYPIILCLS